MKVSGEYTFAGSQDLVWGTLMDPEVLAAVLPGCEKLELVGDNEYEGALNIKVGPVQGKFMGKVKLDDLQEPDSYTMHVDGRGAPGFVKAMGKLALAGAGEETVVSYEGDAQVGGKLASVGQRLIESSAKAIIKQTLDGLNQHVEARGGAAAAGAEGEPATVAKVEKPTEAEFAAAVAKEVAKELVPPWARLAGAVVAALVILYLLSLLVR